VKLTTLYGWACRRCEHDDYYRTKWPAVGDFVYRVPTCPCGAPMAPAVAMGTKQVLPMPSRRRREL